MESRFPELLPRIKKEFDLVVTFDPLDSQKYGLLFYGEVNTKHDLIERTDIEPFDVFYVGNNRGRLPILIEVLSKLCQLRKKCIFYINGVSENDPVIQDFKAKYCAGVDSNVRIPLIGGGFLYLNTYCSYESTLAYVNKCKCVVEVVIEGQSGGTLRTSEAIIYGKKLITNCSYTKEREFYTPEQILVIDKPEEIANDFFEKTFVPVEYDFSPLNMISMAHAYLKAKRKLNIN